MDEFPKLYALSIINTRLRAFTLINTRLKAILNQAIFVGLTPALYSEHA